MWTTSAPREETSMEVLLVPDHPLLRHVGTRDQVDLGPGAPLLACLGTRGGLSVGDLRDSREDSGVPASLEGSYSE